MAALALESAAVLARYTRASVLEVLGQDYVRTVRTKGLVEPVITAPYVLRNALIPVVTVGGLEFAFLITGSFFVESMGSVPGLGWSCGGVANSLAPGTRPRALHAALRGPDGPCILGQVDLVRGRTIRAL